MRNKFLVIMVLIMLTAFGAVSAGANETQTGRQDCTLCHDQYVKNFNNPNVPLVDWIRCYQCHNQGLHTRNYNSTIYRIYYVDPATGYTKTAYFLKDPRGTPADQLHSNHSQPDPRAASCTKCHFSYTCSSCHTTVPHNSHSASKYSQVSLWLTSGVFGGPATYTNSCATSNCHGTFTEPYKAAVTNTDGQELCVNCHSTDKKGHVDQVKLDTAHESKASTLKIGGINYNLSCKGCHKSSLTIEHQVVAQNSRLSTDAECFYCHGNNASSPVKSVVNEIMLLNNSSSDPASNRTCTKCHFDITVLPDGPMEHVTYHIATNSNNLNVAGAPHENCNTCHDNRTVSATVYKLAKIPIVARNYDCFVCHNQQFNMVPVHRASFDGGSDEITSVHAGCNTCHSPGTQSAQKVDGIITNLDSGAQTYQCIDCHSKETLDTEHTGIIDSNCTKSCHNASLTQEHLNNTVTQVNNQDNPLTCATCHNNTQVKFAVTTGNTDCAACHYQAHNLYIVQTMPQDIPKYPGFIWSTPQGATVWSDEAWFNQVYELNSKRVMSNRRTDISSSDIASYYNQTMTANGWTAGLSENVGNTTVLNFTNASRLASVYIYDSDVPYGSTVVSTGYRVDIFYKQ